MFDDSAEECASAEKRGRQIVGQRAVPLPKCHALQRHMVRRPLARVGDQDLDRSERCFSFAEQAVDLLLIRQVRSERHAGRPRFPSQFHGAFGLASEVGDDLRTLAPKGANNFLADASNGACYQYDAIVQAAVHIMSSGRGALGLSQKRCLF